jgi:hypothetical protein
MAQHRKKIEGASDDEVAYRKKRFGKDAGCDSEINDAKREGACGQESEEDCGLCKQKIDFTKGIITTSKHKKINLMHQCRAICKSTNLRCPRHVWEGDENGWRFNAYEQPLWCKQHQEMCGGVKGGGVGHMGWYKSVCDVGGLKQPELKFMDEWIERKDNKENGYELIKTAKKNPSDLRNLANRIENQFWYQFYRKKNPPSTNDIEDAYKNMDFVDFITKYFVFLKECKRRRDVNNEVCFTQTHDPSHDSYLHAISAMVEAMEQYMPVVRDNLSRVEKELIKSSRSLRLDEPQVVFKNKPRIVRFSCTDWGNKSVYVKYDTIEKLNDLYNVAPALYEQVYAQIEYKRIEFVMPSMKTDKSIVSDVSEFAYGTSITYFQESINHVLTTGTILKKDTDQPYVLGMLLFMDFWNIGLVVEDAKTIMHHLIHSSNLSKSIEFLFLSQENGSNEFPIRTYMSKIINEMIDLRINSIIEDYEKRIQHSNQEGDKKKIKNFEILQDTINKYITNHKQYPIVIWKRLLDIKLEKDLEKNKLMIHGLYQDIKKLPN